MPAKGKRPARPPVTKPTATEPEGGSRSSSEKTRIPTPFEEGLELWARFARETGETVTEYLRRFGEEQQKNYESWAAALRDMTKSRAQGKEVEEVQARFDEWNRRAQEIGEAVRAAFLKTLEPQKELFDLWLKPFLPKEATTEDRLRETTELVQKLWTGLATNVSRIAFVAFDPRQDVAELTRVQEASLKEFYDSFQKLTQLYFSSPPFVTLFGRTLDASLDTDRWARERDKFVGLMTGLPTRREITELNDAVRSLTDKVSRMNNGRA